jgi:hypothetical protein
MPRLPTTIRSSVSIHDPTSQTALGHCQRTWRHTVTTGRPNEGRSTSRRRIVCLIHARLPQLEQAGRDSVEAMWTCIGVVQPITPTTSMSASPTRARHINVGSTSTGIPRVGGLRHPHPRGVPVLVRAPSTDAHPATAPHQLPKRHFLPLARLVGLERFRSTAGALLVVAVPGAGVSVISDDEAARALVGFGAAVVLWASAAGGSPRRR